MISAGSIRGFKTFASFRCYVGYEFFYGDDARFDREFMDTRRYLEREDKGYDDTNVYFMN